MNWSNPDDGDHWTGLIVACREGREEAVKVLLALPNIMVNKGDRTALSCACEQGREEIIKLLLKHEEVDVNKADYNGQTPLSVACRAGKEGSVKLLLRDPRVSVNESDNTGQTPFSIACLKGHEEVVKVLLRDERVDVNDRINMIVNLSGMLASMGKKEQPSFFLQVEEKSIQQGKERIRRIKRNTLQWRLQKKKRERKLPSLLKILSRIPRK